MSTTLSQAEIDQVRNEGYICPIPVLEEAEANEYRARLEAVEASQDGHLVGNQRNKSHLLFKWLDDIIRDPRVLDRKHDLQHRRRDPAVG